MKSLKAQTEAKVEAGRQANPDFMKTIDEVIAQAKAFQEGKNALPLGEKAPDFCLVKKPLIFVYLIPMDNLFP